MIDRHQHDVLFSGLEPSPPPPELRGRALAAAKAAIDETRSNRGLCTRLWFNTGLRFAWGAAVVVLLVAHGVLSLRSPSTMPTGHAAGADRPMSARYSPELEEIIDLPRLGADPYAALESERSNGNDA